MSFVRYEMTKKNDFGAKCGKTLSNIEPCAQRLVFGGKVFYIVCSPAISHSFFVHHCNSMDILSSLIYSQSTSISPIQMYISNLHYQVNKLCTKVSLTGIVNSKDSSCVWKSEIDAEDVHVFSFILLDISVHNTLR